MSIITMFSLKLILGIATIYSISHGSISELPCSPPAGYYTGDWVSNSHHETIINSNGDGTTQRYYTDDYQYKNGEKSKLYSVVGLHQKCL